MIEKVIENDELGDILKYKLDVKMIDVNEIILRQIGSVEIIQKHLDRSSEVFLHFVDGQDDCFYSVVSAYEHLFPLAHVPNINPHEYDASVKNMLWSFNQVHKIGYTNKIKSYSFLCPNDVDEVGSFLEYNDDPSGYYFRYYCAEVRFNFIRTLPDRYDIIRNKLDNSLSSTDFKVFKNLNLVLSGLKYPFLCEGFSMYFKFKGKHARIKSDSLLNGLFFLKEKEYSLDESVKRIEDAWTA